MSPGASMVVFSVRFRLSELLVVDAALARKACPELGELLREDFVRVLAEGRVPTSMRLGREARSRVRGPARAQRP